MISWESLARPGRPACVFLDRDGVINERIVDGYVVDWSQFRWRDHAIDALQTLGATKLPLVVVSNQSAVGRGLLTREGLVTIMETMRAYLARRGIDLLAWYCCPHRPDEGCRCRKPGIAMFEACAATYGFDLARSYLIGDAESDVAAGRAAGCATFVVESERPEQFVAAAQAIAAREMARDSV
jgi:D-glycero-D-manno-heptose 1,7-bisphosphate phosphatase